MSPEHPAAVAALVLLALALLVVVLSLVGLVAMRGFYNKLHYLSPPAVLGTALITGAVLAQEGLGASSIKAGLVLATMLVSNPILTFAAARANFLRERVTAPRDPLPAAEAGPGPGSEEAAKEQAP